MRLLPTVAIVALMTTGPALGTIIFSVTGPGGVSSYDPAPGEAFPIQVSITLDISSVMAWSADLIGPPGLIPLPVAIGGVATEPPWLVSGVVYSTTLTNPLTDDAWGPLTLANATCGTWDYEEIPADAVIPLWITPEPASALLLLVGLPLLRRRR